MSFKIRTLDKKNEVPLRKFWLSLLIEKFSDMNQFYAPKERSEVCLKSADFAIEWLKFTNQYQRQFELCLKTFDGRDSNAFNEQFKDSVKSLYEDHTIALGEELLMYSTINISGRKRIVFETYRYDMRKKLLGNIYDEYAKRSRGKIKPEPKEPDLTERFKLRAPSSKVLDDLERKLRRIAQYACIEEAINFINLRIGLHGKYKFKTLVQDFDELVKDFMIDSKGNINSFVSKQKIEDLVSKAAEKYEVLTNPKYMLDENLFRNALRTKFDSILKRRA